MHTVIETAQFLRQAAEAGMTDLDRFHLVTMLGEQPDAGDLIVGTGGARKVRFGGKGKGKSGGFRAITLYTSTSIPVFLLTVFAKGVKVNLTQAERNKLDKLSATLVRSYANKVVTLPARAG
ncbi:MULTISPECIES: type II toxin-antitoxin system RelE/ParE family toxin [unclassified Methylobacterium]|uniref:type II toxin-antitoxin system RelE/ParE family toxin n=1 Tax=unclassified Methylobacterium TaxID=2615210 RepID=UPI002269FDC2|nr:MULTISPECIES: type II toxin-antitoxin system RelE/ParE family toxin [unclassified Methylobacterium]